MIVRTAAAGLQLLIIAISIGFSPSAQATDTATLQLLWTHQATFGGYYVADQKGLYANDGIEIRYLQGGP